MTCSSGHIKLYSGLKINKMTIGINMVILTKVVNESSFVKY